MANEESCPVLSQSGKRCLSRGGKVKRRMIFVWAPCRICVSPHGVLVVSLTVRPRCNLRGMNCDTSAALKLDRLILSGSSEEQTVRLYCAQTGRLIHSAEMYPGRKHGSLYVQSLR